MARPTIVVSSPAGPVQFPWAGQTQWIDSYVGPLTADQSIYYVVRTIEHDMFLLWRRVADWFAAAMVSATISIENCKPSAFTVAGETSYVSIILGEQKVGHVSRWDVQTTKGKLFALIQVDQQSWVATLDVE